MKIEELIGKTITRIDRSDDELIFTISDDEKYKMYHSQDCCESVVIDDIVGDLKDLIGSPILIAAEVCNDFSAKDSYDESFTWTFYKLATVKGYVNIKWYGTSNGYYSENVDFERID
jgi:hypothetical protein